MGVSGLFNGESVPWLRERPTTRHHWYLKLHSIPQQLQLLDMALWTRRGSYALTNML